jgi:hypothetical protein
LNISRPRVRQAGLELLHRVEHRLGGRVEQLGLQRAVGQEQHPIGVRRGARVVGDHDNGLAEIADGAVEEVEDVRGRAGVEVPGRLVGEHDIRAGDQGAGAGDALLLAAGQLGRLVAQPVAEADRVDHRGQPFLIGLPAGQVEGKRDVLERGQGRDQVERLEHEADPVAAEVGQLLLRQGGQVDLTEQHLAVRRLVQPGETVQQRRLPRAGRPHDRGEPALPELRTHVGQRIHPRLPPAVHLPHPDRPNRHLSHDHATNRIDPRFLRAGGGGGSAVDGDEVDAG